MNQPFHAASFAKFVDEQLNHEQRKAVLDQNGVFLVIAGAGSGKTRVITARITNLILQHNVEPSSIVALTFTNKAAQEMQHRIEKFLPHLKTKPTITTFHAYCLKLLKKNSHLTQSAHFSVIDAQDAVKLLQSIIKDRGMDKLFNAKQLLSFFSAYKMHTWLNSEFELWNMHNAQQFMELFNAYEQQKRLANYYDFEDLLYKTYELFCKHSEFQENHFKHHRHILIDEYQDTNSIQHALLKKMTLNNQQLAIDSVCAVGDEDQSIYSWRGATVQNILDFPKEFERTTKIKLEQNYRSTQQILDIANHVISHNVNRHHKQLWSNSAIQHHPLLLECLSDLQEAGLIAQLVQQIAQTEPRSSIAILYRTHYQSRIIEEAFIKDAVPYKMIGGIQFYERKEIKDLLAYLKLFINPFDRISFFRIINCPARGLGEKFEELFLQYWNQNPLCTFTEIGNLLIEHDDLGNKQKTALQSFLNIFTVNIAEFTITQLIEHCVQKINYLTYLQDCYEKQEASEKRENVAEFLRATTYFDEQHPGLGLEHFLDEIALMQELIKQDSTSADRVNMMTLHSAKGLEFPTVILVGLEEGILPNSQAVGEGNIEEERRLFYVGITRAQKKLLICHSKYRNMFGKLDLQRPSRFLNEFPRNLVIEQTAANWSKSSFAIFFQDWIHNAKPSKTTFATQATISPIVDAKITLQQEANIKFKRLQSVKHKIFGVGIAHHVEQKNNSTIVTVHFSHHGTKKIDSSFLEII